jgi:hypothetical protein
MVLPLHEESFGFPSITEVYWLSKALSVFSEKMLYAFIEI